MLVPSPPVCSKCPACPSECGTGWVKVPAGVTGCRQIVAVMMVAIGIVLEAVEVGEVAVAGNADRAVLVIKLVVAGRGPRDKFESAIRQIERVLKVRILAYLVLQISEERDGVRLHILNLIRSGLLGLPHRGVV